ncbi:MAG: hypothetical protein QW343_00985 [Candidatus Norongarragalinales archaeon]
MVVFLVSNSTSAQLSSSAAQEKAGAILGEDAKEVNSLAQPLSVGSDNYWVFFFSIYSPKRILVAVSDSTGDVVDDKDKLYRVGSAVYSYAVIEEFLKQRGWGFAALEPVLTSARGVIEDNKHRLSDFSSQTQALYPGLAPSFSKIDAALSRLNDQASAAESVAKDGCALESAFASDYSASSLNSVFRQYNASLRALESLFASHDALQKEISELSLKLYKVNVTPSDALSINQNLDVLREDGLRDLRNKFVSQRPQLEFARLAAAKDKWVNDSIESMLYRKNRREAIDAVSELAPTVDALLKNEAALTACNVPSNSISKLRKDWNDARYFLSKETALGFSRALEKAEAVKELATEIQRAYAASACVAPQTLQKRVQTQPDYSLAIALVLIILLGAGAFAYYRKKQEELQDFGPPQ